MEQVSGITVMYNSEWIKRNMTLSPLHRKSNYVDTYLDFNSMMSFYTLRSIFSNMGVPNDIFNTIIGYITYDVYHLKYWHNILHLIDYKCIIENRLTANIAVIHMSTDILDHVNMTYQAISPNKRISDLYCFTQDDGKLLYYKNTVELRTIFIVVLNLCIIYLNRLANCEKVIFKDGRIKYISHRFLMSSPYTRDLGMIIDNYLFDKKVDVVGLFTFERKYLDSNGDAYSEVEEL